MRPIVRFAAVLVLLAACGEGPLSPGSFTLDGSWSGRAFPLALRMELDQDAENRVTGTGRIVALEEVLDTVRMDGVLDTVRIDTISIDSVQVDVRGQWDYPRFTLRLVSEGFADARYEGNWAAQPDTITGTLRGSGFDASIPIIRQDD